MADRTAPLPMPEHFDPQHATDAAYLVADTVSLQTDAEHWRRRHDLPVAADDGTKVHLLAVDNQVDFSFPEGSLYVAGRSGTGATDAHLALARFIYANLHVISEITCTLDSHLPFQIFFPCAHLDEHGNHPAAHTVITAADYRSRRYRPNPAMAAQLGVSTGWLQRHVLHYCSELELAGKHQLYLWPYHCLIGSAGHRLAGIVEEARLFHSFARGAANRPTLKGANPLSECYSVFKEEVTSSFDGEPIPGVRRNTSLIGTLLAADAIVVAGLAASHCVRETVSDLLDEIQRRDQTLARKVYILRDCTASVVVSGGQDFTDVAEGALQFFSGLGVNLVDSTTPIATWPGIRL